MIPALFLTLERHGRPKPTSAEHALLLTVSAATIDWMVVDTKTATAGGRRRRGGFYSAIRREVPIRTFNDWANPPPGFSEIVIAHGGTSVAGSFIRNADDDGYCNRSASRRWQPRRRINDASAGFVLVANPRRRFR